MWVRLDTEFQLLLIHTCQLYAHVSLTTSYFSSPFSMEPTHRLLTPIFPASHESEESSL